MSGVEFPARWPECRPEAILSDEDEREDRRNVKSLAIHRLGAHASIKGYRREIV
jgi:hypothetical protein